MMFLQKIKVISSFHKTTNKEEYLMKKIFSFVVPALIISTLSGCGFYGSINKYEKGEWLGWASQRQAAEWKSQKLAYDKMQTSSVVGDPVKGGYEGVVANESWSKVTIQISGPEKRSFYMEPGRAENVRLVPGRYTAHFYAGGYLEHSEAFTVELRENSYKGQQVAWFVVYHR